MKYTLSQIKRALRRKWLILFKPKYVMKQLALRKGNCKRQGCCKFSGMNNCKWLVNNDCERWDNLPFECLIYPIDRKDMTEFSKLNCGFSWNE